MRVICILDTMWGDQPGRAVRFFPISPDNHSGRRLYKILGAKPDESVWVTNACKHQVSHSREHGKPAPEWLQESLQKFQPDFILVCGAIAKATFMRAWPADIPLKNDVVRILFIPHPAARTWTKNSIKQTRRKIQRVIRQFNKGENK